MNKAKQPIHKTNQVIVWVDKARDDNGDKTKHENKANKGCVKINGMMGASRGRVGRHWSDESSPGLRCCLMT